jgi:anti-sigma regulatory factor (Ser/Thr protein kinase)
MNTAGLIHQALFYDTPERLTASLAPFILRALRQGDAVLAVTTPGNIRAMTAGLGDDAGRVEFMDSAAWYDAPGRTMAAYHRYVLDRREKHDRVWMIGEPLWLDRDAIETDGWTRYDSAYNLTFANLPASIICLYNRVGLPAAVIADATLTHPVMTVPGGTERNAAYANPQRFWSERSSAFAPPPHGTASMRFAADPRPVRWFIAEQAARLGLSPNRVDDLVIAVNEVVTNAIRHGAGHGEVQVWRDGSRMLCAVTDPGHVASELIGFVPGDPESDHGHGLWLTRQLTDLLEIRNSREGTTVRLYMRLGS